MTALGATLKTTAALLALKAVLPVNLVWTAGALVRARLISADPAPAVPAKTVLISGGKMTKALALARAFHRSGHRVVLVEASKYRLTGHRFSTAVAAFHTVPAPTDPGYAQAVANIVRAEKVDVYVPVCAPAASYPDALAAQLIAPYCETVHGTPEQVRALDDKFAFSDMAAQAGLTVPQCHRVTSAQQLRDFDFGSRPGMSFVLKNLEYDPVNRLDLTRLPTATTPELENFLADKTISAENPWILQEFISGREYCTHGTVRSGRVQVYCCCPSSAFQINYESVDKPAIFDWVTTFVAHHGLTGQASFDFIESDRDGSIYAIECNPRTHSAITMFYDQSQALADAYLLDDQPMVTPTPTSEPTYWIYHEVWRLIRGQGSRRERLQTIRTGKDAIFDGADPLPFLLVHHLQIPSLLFANLIRVKDWIKVDFNIGKIVQAAGD